MPRASYFAFVFCCLFVLSASTEAAVQYDLVADRTGDIWVSMFLDFDPQVTAITESSLPIPFELMPVAADWSGASHVVPGVYEFDIWDSLGLPIGKEVIDVGDGYLRSTGMATVELGTKMGRVWPAIYTQIAGDGFATWRSEARGVQENGAWIRVQNAVPEPASVIVWTFCLAVGSGFGARRRRRT